MLRATMAIGLLVTMFAGVSFTSSAQTVNPSKYPDFFTQGVNECYFASVSNGESFGLASSRTSVTVQNLSDERGVVYLVVGAEGGFADGQFAVLEAGASKTFTAQSLGVPSGKTAPVVVMGYDFASAQSGTFAATDGIAIGCVAKQAVAGMNLPSTSSVDQAVSGYNATSGREVGFFHDLYLPIVQTNCGPGGCWDTIVRVANVGPFDNAAVTVRFFPADDGSGSLSTGFQVQRQLGQGELASIKLSDLVPDGWVGSAHIYSDDSIVAIADRFKAGTRMWITNTAANAVAESGTAERPALQLPTGPSSMPYVLYAPDVRLDFNGWNTGISVANTVDVDNTVNIQYFGNSGNAPQAQTQRLGAHGMTYFYNPSSPSEDGCAQPATQVATCDYVGGAIILSQRPVAVAVDGVKYFGNDANVGQAFSYNATGNVFRNQAAPLVQKGSPSTGMGATSGITFLNTNGFGAYITATWLNPSGFAASNFGPSVVWVPAYATGFVYTMTQHNLPNGFTGSAIVTSDLPIAATSANVDYAVNGDGTAIWNLYNPCGLYRSIGTCVYTPEPPAPATKTFDVRPLGANPWICVYAATSGQSKPIAPTSDCLPQQVFAKGSPDSGQDDVRSLVAHAWQRITGSFLLDPDSTGSWIVQPITGAAPVPVAVRADYENNRLTFTGQPDGAQLFLSYWKLPNGAHANLICRDLATHDVLDERLPWLEIASGGTISGATLAEIGDLNDAVLIVFPTPNYEDGYCAQLETGIVRAQTPAEMQEQLGTVVPPFQLAGDGKGSIQLPAGCYFFGVSAVGYVTEYSDLECLAPGDVVPNRFDLDVVPGEMLPATKTFDISGGAPSWVCTWAAEVVPGVIRAQPTDPCLPQTIAEPIADNDGAVQHYSAFDWSITFIGPSPRQETITPLLRHQFPFIRTTFDYDANIVGADSAHWAGSWIAYRVENGTNVPTTCSDLRSILEVRDWEAYGFVRVPVNDGSLPPGAVEDIGDPAAAIFIFGFAYDAQVFCAPLVEVTPRWETAAEMQARLGTTVPPFQIDADGQESVVLPAGCYYFTVSNDLRANPTTQYSGLECLTPGQLVPNTFSFSDVSPGTFTLTKYMCDAVDFDAEGGPCLGPQDGHALELTYFPDDPRWVGTPTGNGAYEFTDLSFGGYQLCSTGPGGVNFVKCELVYLVGDMVLYNDTPSVDVMLCTSFDIDYAEGEPGYCVDPLSDLQVRFFDGNTPVAEATAGANGFYTFGTGPAGTYALCWTDGVFGGTNGCREDVAISPDMLIYVSHAERSGGIR